MEELKPCPFCGEEPLIFFGDETRWEDDHEGWVIGCITENCKGHISLSWSFWGFDGKEKAITAWNTRAERTCHLELNPFYDYRGTQHDYLGCSKCGEFISTTDSYGPDDGPFYCSNCGSAIDHSFITDYVSGETIWMAEDGDLGDLADEKNWRGAKVVS